MQTAAEAAPALYATGDQAQDNHVPRQQDNSLAHSLAALPPVMEGQSQRDVAHANQAAPPVSHAP